MFSAILFCLSVIMGIGWSFPFIIAPLFGLQFYIISEQKMVKFLKKLKNHSSLIKNDEADGWIIGWPFVGYISGNSSYEKLLYIFTFRSFFIKKMKEIEVTTLNKSSNEISNKSSNEISNEISNENKVKKTILIYEREGNFSHFSYPQREFIIENITPRPCQKKIVNKIISFYEKNGNCVTILHGERGTGKSMIPLLLAKTLSKNTDKEEMVNFCDTFSPIDPGDQFSRLYNRISPTKNSPLIVLLEEFDMIIHKIHEGKIERHLQSPIMIHDKATWNQFFDRFDRNYYPWTIFILTSNTSPDIINNIDPSFIRDGRINQIFHVTI